MRRLVIVILLCSLVASCTSIETGESDLATVSAVCLVGVEEAVSLAREFVAPYAELGAADLASEVEGVEDLAAQVETIRAETLSAGCTVEEFERLLDRGLETVVGAGPVGRRLALSIRGLDVASLPTRTVDVANGESLLQAVVASGAGSTIRLTESTYEVDETVVIDRALTIRAAGVDGAALASTALGAAVLVVSGGELVLEGVAIVHEGDQPGSGIVIGSGGVTLQGVSVEGAVAADDGSDGHGIVLASPGPHRLVDVESSANEGAGVLLIDAEGDLTTVAADDNALCGVCWTGSSSGSAVDVRVSGGDLGVGIADESEAVAEDVAITDADIGVEFEGRAAGSMSGVRVADGSVGLRVAGESTVSVESVSIEGSALGIGITGTAAGQLRDVAIHGTEIGLQAAGAATTRLLGLDVRGPADGGLLIAEESAVTFEGVSVASDALGLQVSDAARPTIGGMKIAGSGPVGVLLVDDADGDIDGLEVDGFELGIQIGGRSTSRVTDATVTGATEAEVAVLEQSAPRIEVTCPDPVLGIFVDAEADPEIVGDGCPAVR